MSEEPIEVEVRPVPVKKRRGPKAVLDPLKRAEVCAILAMGLSRRNAAAYVGCDPNTIVNTAKREPEFAAAILKAEVQQEFTLLTKIHAATKQQTGWRAATWLLQRLHPDRYSRKAGTMTRKQMASVLSQFAEILSRGIRDPTDRRKVGKELLLLTSALQSQGNGDIG